MTAALEAARAEISDLSAALDAEKRRAEEATRVAARAEEQMRAAASSASALRDQLKEVKPLLFTRPQPLLAVILFDTSGAFQPKRNML